MDRDVEKITDRKFFAKTLRRVADAVESGESFRIQVAGHRLTVPADATVSIEHEAEEGEVELELQFSWKG
jgi:amphi-Trp domain-containing protein